MALRVDTLRIDNVDIEGASGSTKVGTTNPASETKNLSDLSDTDSGEGADMVAFKQAGTGAVARTVYDKLRERVSAFDFMTAAQIADARAQTGSIDCTAALQAAIDAGHAASVPVYINPGHFLISSKLTWNSDAEIYGAGKRTRIVTETDITMLAPTASADNWNVSRITLGPRTETTKPAVHIGPGCNRWTMSEVEMDNFNEGGHFYDGFFLEGCTLGTLFKCVAQDCLRYGFFLDDDATAAYKPNGITLYDCLGEENGTEELHAVVANGLQVIGGTYEGTLADPSVGIYSCDSPTITSTWIENDKAGGRAITLSGVDAAHIRFRCQGGDNIVLTGSSLNFIGPIVGSPLRTSLDANSNNNFLFGQFDSDDVTDGGANNIVWGNKTPAIFQKRIAVDNLPFNVAPDRELIDLYWSSNQAYVVSIKAGDASARAINYGTIDAQDCHLISNNTKRWTVLGSDDSGALYGRDNLIWQSERADPSAPDANHVYRYARDNGSGQTQWVAKFATGAVQVMATQGGRNSGASTITNGNTSVVVAHGLSVTPTAQQIHIIGKENPTNDIGNIWVDTIGAANFTVNIRNDPGASNWDFGWSVDTNY